MIGKEIGPYKVLEKIGQGGMGIVYKGVHTRLEQDVAIKVLSPEFSRDLSMQERFVREAKIQVKLSHPNVVNILNYLEDGGDVFLIMEYINGETLEHRLKSSGAFPVEKAVRISLKVLEALEFMHSKGIVHRDIKPSNIMFTDSGVVKVTDFGISKVIGERGQTRTGMRIGTLWYMSPEQIRGEEATTVSDIYSFGITFYQMVTGGIPFSGDSEYTIMKGHLEQKPLPPWKINANVSKQVGRVILKSLSKDPKDRYRNIREFAEDLGAAIKTPQEAKTLPKVPENAKPWKVSVPSLNLDRKQSLIALVSLGIILLILTFALFYDGGKEDDKEEISNRKVPLGMLVPVTGPDQPKTDTDFETSVNVSSVGTSATLIPLEQDVKQENTTEDEQQDLPEVSVEKDSVEEEKQVSVKQKKQVSEAPATEKRESSTWTAPENEGGWGIRK